MKSNLIDAQSEMRQRIKKKPTPRGRKVGKVKTEVTEAESTRAQRRYVIYAMLKNGVSMSRTILEVHRRFGIRYTSTWISDWAASGYPLENQSTMTN